MALSTIIRPRGKIPINCEQFSIAYSDWKSSEKWDPMVSNTLLKLLENSIIGFPRFQELPNLTSQVVRKGPHTRSVKTSVKLSNSRFDSQFERVWGVQTTPYTLKLAVKLRVWQFNWSFVWTCMGALKDCVFPRPVTSQWRHIPKAPSIWAIGNRALVVVL